jgi:hypothetical protein
MIDDNYVRWSLCNTLSGFGKGRKRLFGFWVNLVWCWILIHLRYANSPSGDLVSPT